MTPRHTEDGRAQHCGSCIPVQGVIGTSVNTILLEAFTCNAHAMLSTCFAQKRATHSGVFILGLWELGSRGNATAYDRLLGHFLGGTRRIVLGVAVDAFV